MKNTKLVLLAMVAILNSPKKIDELKLCPAQVKDGILLNFNGDSLGTVDAEDGELFSVDRVNKTQAVTVALKRDYTNAIKEWLGDAPKEAKEPKAVKEPKAEKSHSPADEVKALIKAGKLKKAGKVLKANKDSIDKKLYKALKQEV